MSSLSVYWWNFTTIDLVLPLGLPSLCALSIIMSCAISSFSAINCFTNVSRSSFDVSNIPWNNRVSLRLRNSRSLAFAANISFFTFSSWTESSNSVHLLFNFFMSESALLSFFLVSSNSLLKNSLDFSTSFTLVAIVLTCVSSVSTFKESNLVYHIFNAVYFCHWRLDTLYIFRYFSCPGKAEVTCLWSR